MFNIMVRHGIYNEVKDNQAVDQIGFVDLAEAIENGFVPGSLGGDDMVYNGIEDPSTIMHNASDVFELYRQADYLKSYGASSKNDAVTQSGEITE